MTGRFAVEGEAVVDSGSGLMWPRSASPATFPMSWTEALAYIQTLNDETHLGYGDWRLPNRRELFSLISHETVNPALPAEHPFSEVFNGYYWTSTTCCRLPDQAWYIHLGGARVFKGMKYASYMVWPVRTADFQAVTVYKTGQKRCYDQRGRETACAGTGQDGQWRSGRPWPQPRWKHRDDVVEDRLTGLIWMRCADFGVGPVDWPCAREMAAQAASKRLHGVTGWRLPTVRELESLCDMEQHSPALPTDHPFQKVQAYYWSDTTSRYETRYAWALYLEDGNIGVGYKAKSDFHAWLVSDGPGSAGRFNPRSKQPVGKHAR